MAKFEIDKESWAVLVGLSVAKDSQVMPWIGFVVPVGEADAQLVGGAEQQGIEFNAAGDHIAFNEYMLGIAEIHFWFPGILFIFDKADLDFLFFAGSRDF